MESIGDDVNPIFFLQVSQDFFGVGEYVGFGRSSVHKIFLKYCRNCFGISSCMSKYPGKSFFSQVMLVDLAHIVPIPKLEINCMEGFEKFFKGGNPQVLKAVNLVEFGERFGDISIVVPQGVIEIEEEVLVRFQSGFSVGTGCFGSY